MQSQGDRGEALVKENNQRTAAKEAEANALAGKDAPERAMWASAYGRATEASATEE